MNLSGQKKPNGESIRTLTVIILAGVLVLAIVFAGCTRTAGTIPETPLVPVTGEPSSGSQNPVMKTGEPATPPPETTGTPEPVATMVRYISQVRDVKDSELLFALQVPVEWNVTTYRIENTEITEGLMYQTDLDGNNTFFIRTYAITRGQDQAYRDECRMWSPAPEETTVTINGITFDRFESTYGGITNVTYVVRKASANERGYASVLSYSSSTGNPFEKEDYENVIFSFRYLTGSSAGTVSGEEILRLASQGDSSGSPMSAKGSSDSGGSSSGGCSCCRG